jgi:serine phosphatase RsbU (regulator of sigma subunit)
MVGMDDVQVAGAWSRDEQSRLSLLGRVLRDGSLLRGALDLITDAVTITLEVPVALVSLVGRERQHFVGETGMAPAWAAGTPITHSFCQHVVERGGPLVIETSVEDPLVCDNPAIQDLGVAAYAGQPIIVHGHVIGSLCAIDTVSHAWTARDVAALRAFADLAEYLIEARLVSVGQLLDEQAGARARDQQQTARLRVYEALTNEHSEVQALNRRLQHALLPRPSFPSGLQVDVFYRPGSDRLLLGGDFVDTTQLSDGGLDFVIGDVIGHGPEAAALAISLRASWRALQAVGCELARIVEVLDRQTVDADLYATVLLGRITPAGHLCVISAGHPAPIIVGEQGVTELSGQPGPMLGLDPDSTWSVGEHRLADQTLIAYTDGLIEGRVDDTRERFGVDRLLATIAELGPEPEGLCRVATTANREPLPDDVAILRINPA